jgi:hypothetical protein
MKRRTRGKPGRPDGREFVERLGIAPEDLPLMICPNGTLLTNPSDADAAFCLGIMRQHTVGCCAFSSERRYEL